jgi:hypothetical protein
MIRYLKSAFTMTIIGYMFTDRVSGRPVYKYVDCYGTYWMAHLSYTPVFGFRTVCENQNDSV